MLPDVTARSRARRPPRDPLRCRLPGTPCAASSWPPASSPPRAWPPWSSASRGSRRLPADQRAGVLLVTQTGVANFVAWLGERGETIRLTAEAFRIAPRDLARRLSLRQTVDLVRIATEVFERHLPPLAADEAERQALVEGVLRFGREIAFAAATVYAGAAETRGAWDARLEALVVDAVVRGPNVDGGADDALVSRAAALGWDPAAAVRVVAGSPAPDGPRRAARRAAPARRPGRPLGAGRRAGQPAGAAGLGAASRPRRAAIGRHRAPRRRVRARPGRRRARGRRPGRRPTTAPATRCPACARRRGWPDAPRPVAADDLLPERALAGDPAAHRAARRGRRRAPVEAAGGELLRTLACYLEGGGALEACARTLFVHPNTVRYRLRRVSELTGPDPTDPRDALVLRTAVDRRPARRLPRPGTTALSCGDPTTTAGRDQDVGPLGRGALEETSKERAGELVRCRYAPGTAARCSLWS